MVFQTYFPQLDLIYLKCTKTGQANCRLIGSFQLLPKFSCRSEFEVKKISTRRLSSLRTMLLLLAAAKDKEVQPIIVSQV